MIRFSSPRDPYRLEREEDPERDGSGFQSCRVPRRAKNSVRRQVVKRKKLTQPHREVGGTR